MLTKDIYEDMFVTFITSYTCDVGGEKEVEEGDGFRGWWDFSDLGFFVCFGF